MQPIEITAIKYAHLANRHPGESFILADPHEYGPDLDYFVWVLRRGDSTWLIDTGFAQPAAYYSQYDNNRFRVALNYNFNEALRVEKDKSAVPDRGPGSWEIHGQTTFIYQGYPPFAAAYSGQNSLPPVGQSRQTWTTSAFLGVRLWEGGALYFNPELLQGFGVANTTGAAGYPNGEAQKSNFPFPRFRQT